MKLDIAREEVWAASLEDRPGALAEKLEALAQAGADIEFGIARRCPDKPGTGVIFLTPLRGARQVRAARKAGFEKTKSLYSVRVRGANKPGLGAQITQVLAQAGINLRGLSAAALARQAVLHLAFDTTADANKAVRRLKALSS